MNHYHFSCISSTNDYAKELLNKVSPVYVTADYQWQGRGRNNKHWQGNFGENIFLSVGIAHKTSPDAIQLSLYQAVGCLAVKASLIEKTGSDIFVIKYPNDIYAKNSEGQFKKISGILIENIYQGSECLQTIIGIGVNVRQTEFSFEIQDTATSLSLLGFDLKPSELLPIINKNIEKYLMINSTNLFQIWKSELAIEGKIININGDDSIWQVDKIMENGRLLVFDTSNRISKVIHNGESIRYSFD